MESQKKLMEGIIYMFRYQKKFKTEVEDAIEYKNAQTLRFNQQLLSVVSLDTSHMCDNQ